MAAVPQASTRALVAAVVARQSSGRQFPCTASRRGSSRLSPTPKVHATGAKGADATLSAESGKPLRGERQKRRGQSRKQDRTSSDVPSILPPARLRVETRPHCYEQELASKVASLRALFECDHKGRPPLSVPTTEVFCSPPEHFRERAEFRIWHPRSHCRDRPGDERDAGDSAAYHEPAPQYVMFEDSLPRAVQRFPMASKRICDELMPTLINTVQTRRALRHKLFQANFHTTLAGDALVTLLYHRQLDEAWTNDAKELREALGGASVVGRARKQKVVVGRDWVQEALEVQGREGGPLRYRQLEGAFSQPNAAVCRHMLEWARAAAVSSTHPVGAPPPAEPRPDDMLELYCGNGNFTVALAPLFRRVLATELSKALTAAAETNSADNGATNIAFARLSAEEVEQALGGRRSFKRLEHIKLADYRLNTLLVDPPRAGLGPEVAAFAKRFDRVIYVSCNPTTLREDVEILRHTHDITRLAVFDQFPYTDHLESGVLLVRRAGVEEPSA
mmetsp:Transcript_20871/g.71096  ORF Transcript_20871/g.71096 Transcript_20871/m.71096 type:complete len:506 (-) Transcript_20871:1625-3142(-)